MTQRLSDRLARYGLLPAGQPANFLPGRGSVAYQLEGACREGIAARRHAPRRSPSRAALAVFQAALHLAEPCAALLDADDHRLGPGEVLDPGAAEARLS